MSRNDPRMQRGLAVARRMRDLDRGMSELAWLGSRLNAADLQAIQAADARGGLGAVRQLLAGAGLTDAGFAALEAQYQRGGLHVVGAAVQAQITHERQASAEQEAVGALEKLQPAQWAAVQQILATGGPEALAQRAAAMGLSPEAAVVAARHLAANGVEQTRQAVAEQAQARAKTEAVRAAAEREFAAGQKDATWDALSGPDVARATLAFYATHAAALEAAGVGARPGEGPVRWLRRVAGTEGAADRVAAVTGTDTAAMRTIIQATREREGDRSNRELAGKVEERLGERDGKRPRPETTAPRNELRETIKGAVAEHGGAGQERLAVGNSLQATIALSAGRDPGELTTISHAADREIQRTADRLEAPEPVTLRSTIEAAVTAEEERSNG